MANDILLFIVFYFGVSVALVILSVFFKTIIKKFWFLKIPLFFSGIIFFPFGLIMLGYCLRIWDENRAERIYYAGDESVRENEETYQIDSTVKW